ncbi:MAG: signal peptidase I [Patescibacteria group bacterium]
MDKKKFFKKLIGWIIYIAILAGLVLGIPRALSHYLNTQYPMASITSGSMWPVLKKGDLVFIKGVNDKKDIQEEDIVIYNNREGFTIHRIVSMGATTITTKGDANKTMDSPVKYEEIVGKTVNFKGKPLRIPYLGNISMILMKK